MKELLLSTSIIGIILFSPFPSYAQYCDGLSWNAIPIKTQTSNGNEGAIARNPAFTFPQVHINKKILLIEFLSLIDNAELTVMNINTGKMVHFEVCIMTDKCLIDLGAEDVGLYQIEITVDNTIFYGKFSL